MQLYSITLILSPSAKNITSILSFYQEIICRKAFRICILFPVLLMAGKISVQGQSAKEVNTRYQTWFSLNTLSRLSNKWGVMADFHHVRRDNLVAKPRFYFIRVGTNYWINDKVSLSLAYGHMWLAPSVDGWKNYSQENRIHEQFQVNSKLKKVSVVQRLRNEQRWQQIMVNDEPSGKLRFTNRVRYLASFNIPLFKNEYLPSMVMADEIMVQFGKDVIYNTFDQNRIFAGIRQKISRDISFDFGYMRVFQQKNTGYQYDLYHTFRLFFYYTPDFRKNFRQTHHHSGDE